MGKKMLNNTVLCNCIIWLKKLYFKFILFLVVKFIVIRFNFPSMFYNFKVSKDTLKSVTEANKMHLFPSNMWSKIIYIYIYTCKLKGKSQKIISNYEKNV